jgi:hypothetical protein
VLSSQWWLSTFSVLAPVQTTWRSAIIMMLDSTMHNLSQDIPNAEWLNDMFQLLDDAVHAWLEHPRIVSVLTRTHLCLFSACLGLVELRATC